MPDPYSLPATFTHASTTPPRSRLGFLPGLIRYLAAASLLQLGFLALVRLALLFQYHDFGVLGLLGMASPVLSLVLASVFFRRFTNIRWAIASILVTLSASAYLLVRFTYAYMAWQHYTTLVEPVMRRFRFVDLTTGNEVPPAMGSYLPLDTSTVDGMQLSDTSSNSLRGIKRNLAEQLHIRCDASVEDAIRACARFPKVDLGSKSQADLLICAGTIATLTVPSNDSIIYVDSNRVILELLLRSRGVVAFQQIQGDTEVTFFPDTMATRIRHKRDSLRLWREDSARTASGK